MTIIGVHKMHGQCTLIKCNLFVDSSSLAYFMVTHPLSIASKLAVKSLVAKQLPTNVHVHLY